MTHPASIFPISALAVSAILLLSSCSIPSTTATSSAYSADRLVTKSVLALITGMTPDADTSHRFLTQNPIAFR